MTNFAVLDLETTGLHPGAHHRIIEIGVVLTDASDQIAYEWSTLVNPSRDLGPTGLHGITAAMVSDAPGFADVADDLASILEGRVLVAHNARFDVGFLESEWQRMGTTWPIDALCTMQLARRRGLPAKLERCCAELGVVNEDAHHALSDARVTARLLEHLQPAPDELPGVMRAPWTLPAWTGAGLPRQSASTRVESGLMAALVARLPDDIDYGFEAPVLALDAYRDALERALQDRILTPEEVADLARVAEQWGLTLAQTATMHETYLARLVAVAAADRVVTEAEMTDLSRVSDLLGVERRILNDAIEQALSNRRNGSAVDVPCDPTASDMEGLSVCFTGDSTCSHRGRPLDRAARKALVEARGMTVKSGVSKKLDILVVADPDTQSSKARKARDYGTRIIAERAFWQQLGVNVD